MRENINKCLWAISLVLFVAGISLPMFTMEKFYFFSDTFSLLGGLYQLLEGGEIFLFLLILVFSVLMPLYKFGLSFRYVFNLLPTLESRLIQIKKISMIGKWSMADVFVIAVLASTIKVGGFAHVSVHIGLIIFGLSVLLSLVLSHSLMSKYELKLKADPEKLEKK